MTTQSVIINANSDKGIINKNIYGHFAEHLGRGIYEGIWVGEDSSIPNTKGIRNDVLSALKNLNIPVLRWPGGCFADGYHWKDGVGAKKDRKQIVNADWGKTVENNQFGTHEFMMLCNMLGCDPYIAGNVGSGTVQEMQEWLEYMTFDGTSTMSNWRKENGRDKPWSLKYFGIGNENWGCGGNMRPEYYSDVYRNYQTYAMNYGENDLYKIASGPNEDDYQWTKVLMDTSHSFMDGLSLHYYTVPYTWEEKGSATDPSEEAWFKTMNNALHMDELIKNHSTIMDQYDPDKEIGLVVDEWGTWYDAEPGTNPDFLFQQNTLRDALVAGLHFHIFHEHNDRVHMANIAQTVNVLQAMVLTNEEKMILTPTYHVFEMFKVHQNAQRLAVSAAVDSYTKEETVLPQVSVSASKSEENNINVSLCNIDPNHEAEVTLQIQGLEKNDPCISGRVLTSDHTNDHNTFENPHNVSPRKLEDITLFENKLSVTLPPKSVSIITLS